MFLTITSYVFLSLFVGTLTFLFKFRKRDDKKETQDSIVVLLVLQTIPLVVLLGVTITSSFKSTSWLAPVTSFWSLVIWFIIVSLCIMVPLLIKEGMLIRFFKDNGLRLFSYSLISAISMFFMFLIIIGALYTTIDGFKVKGFSNFIGIAGIVTTLMGILVALLQFLNLEEI